MKLKQERSGCIQGLLSIVAVGVVVTTSTSEALAACAPNSGMQTEEIVVLYDGGWKLADDRKTEDIVICEGNKAELVFRVDPRYATKVRIHSVDIVAGDGGRAPRDEFVIPAAAGQSSSRDFRDATTQSVSATEVKVLNNNRKIGVYNYTVRIKTNRGDVRVVDPKIRNGGGAN